MKQVDLRIYDTISNGAQAQGGRLCSRHLYALPPGSMLFLLSIFISVTSEILNTLLPLSSKNKSEYNIWPDAHKAKEHELSCPELAGEAAELWHPLLLSAVCIDHMDALLRARFPALVSLALLQDWSIISRAHTYIHQIFNNGASFFLKLTTI